MVVIVYLFDNQSITKWDDLKKLSQYFTSKNALMILIPAFFFRKKGYINFVSKSDRRPSVRPSVMFLVNVSPPKPKEVATSNFVGE